MTMRLTNGNALLASRLPRWSWARRILSKSMSACAGFALSLIGAWRSKNERKSVSKSSEGSQQFCAWSSNARIRFQNQVLFLFLLLTCFTVLAQPKPPVASTNIFPPGFPKPAPTNVSPLWVESYFSLGTNQVGYLQYSTSPTGPWTNIIKTWVGTNGCVTNRLLLNYTPGSSGFYRTKITQ